MKRLITVLVSACSVSGCSLIVLVTDPSTPIIQMPTFLMVDLLLLVIVMIILLAVIAARLKTKQ